jgi:hypothetical protein
MSEAQVVQAYSALEKMWLETATDAMKVQWFQQRAISAEEANAALTVEAETKEIITKFPDVEAADLVGLKTKAERENVAGRIQAKVEKAKLAGQTIVEAAVQEALKGAEEDIKEMRKVYGKARVPQAGDVTGSGAAQIAAAQATGVGVKPEEIENGSPNAVNRAVAAAADPVLRALGFK